MDASLTDRIAIVTGAARGIGRAIALQFARAGAHVVIADINLRAAQEFNETLSAESVGAEVEAMGVRSLEVESDLTQRAEAERLVAQAMSEFGRVDIMVNAAGGATTPAERSTPLLSPDEDMADIFAKNYSSTVYCCQNVGPIMVEQGNGAIINFSSLAGTVGALNASFAHYGASKAAVSLYTRALAAEVGPAGVRANCINPGIIMSSRVAAQAEQRNLGTQRQARAIPLRRLGQPQDVAGVAQFLASDLAQYVSGQCIAVNGGSHLGAT